MKKKLTKILSIILFCDLEDLPSVTLHIPVGLIIGAIPIIFACLGFLWQGREILALGFAIVGATLGALFGWGFVKYQTVERRVIKDDCYPDIQGMLWGIGIASIGCAIIILLWILQR